MTATFRYPREYDNPPHAATADRALLVLSDAEMQSRPKPKQIVEGIWLEASTSAIVGPPGAGKGLILTDLFYRTAHGMDYYGHATAQGTCVYVALERSGGLGVRIRAWKAHYHRPEPAPVYFIPQRFSLFEPDGATRLIAALDELPPPIRFVGIDTVAKGILPGNENETKDMGQFVANLQRVAETGPNVLCVHHTNKNGDLERGSTAFRGDVDTLIKIKPADGRVTMESDKSNELAAFAPIELRIQPVPEVDSATVVYCNAVNEKMLTPLQLKMIESLHVAAMGTDASSSVWMKAFGADAGSERSFYYNRSSLVARGYVSRSDGTKPRYSLTLAGLSAMTATLQEGAK